MKESWWEFQRVFAWEKRRVLKKNRGEAIFREKVFDIRSIGKEKKVVDDLEGFLFRKIERFYK